MWTPDLDDIPGPRYLAIAEALARDLDTGRLTPGTRLPTHRDLAESLGVTVGTVSRGYTEARRRGLVTGEVGRGTFVRSQLAEPGLLGRSGAPEPGLIDLSLNYPAFAPTDDELLPVMAAIQKRGGLGRLLRYQNHAGALHHRRIGSEWIGRTGLETSPERTIVTCGAQHAMLLAFSILTEPGDLVLTEALTYTGMKALARSLRLRLEGVPLDEGGMRPDALAEACGRERPKAIYCTPAMQNPTATLMPAERRREIARVALSHGIPLVEDDLYSFLLPRPIPPISAAMGDLGYYITSLSKCVSPGLRVGYLHAPRSAIESLEAAMMTTTTMASPLTAEIGSILVEDGTADSIARQRRRETETRQRIARQILGKHVPASSCRESYHIWLNLPEPWRAEEFVAQARGRGIAVSSAETFAVGRGPVPHAVRVCLGATEQRATLERGLRALSELLSHPPQPTLSGV